MTIPCFDFDEQQLQACDSLFPSEIDRDLWVLYHATSSSFEEQIDSEGLGWSPAVYSKQDLEAIASIYTSMNWCGISMGGMAVIGSYSLMSDFGVRESKPIYFRELSMRSICYSTSEFAGGESARAIRHAMRDLQAYLETDTLRKEHYEHQRQTCLRALQSGSFPTRVMRVDLSWLAERVQSLGTLWQRCVELEENHTHGVVYAARFVADDLPSCQFDSGMGLKCYCNLSADRIVAKARILTDAVNSVESQGIRAFRESIRRQEDPSGMLYALSQAENPMQASHRSLPTAPNIRTDLLDLAAGHDEWPELLAQFGSPDVIAYIREKEHPSSMERKSGKTK